MSQRNTRHLVDPEIAPVIDLIPFREFDRATLDLVRSESAGRFTDLGDPPIAADVRTIEGPGGPLEVHWYDPAPGSTARTDRDLLGGIARLLRI